MDELGDSELIGRFQQGDRDAFGLLVERYQRQIYHVARGMLRSHALAEEAAQNAFVKAWQSLGNFRGDSSFKTWMYRIAMNAAHDLRSRERTRSSAAEQLAREPESVQPTVSRPRPLDEMIREQELARVRLAVERLPDRQRTTLQMRVEQGLMYSEIAECLGCPVGTVKANFHHAVENLKKYLGESKPAAMTDEPESDSPRGEGVALRAWGRSTT